MKISYGVGRPYRPQGEFGPTYWIVPEFKIWRDGNGQKWGSWRWVCDDTKEPVKRR